MVDSQRERPLDPTFISQLESALGERAENAPRLASMADAARGRARRRRNRNVALSAAGALVVATGAIASWPYLSSLTGDPVTPASSGQDPVGPTDSASTTTATAPASTAPTNTPTRTPSASGGDSIAKTPEGIPWNTAKPGWIGLERERCDHVLATLEPVDKDAVGGGIPLSSDPSDMIVMLVGEAAGPVSVCKFAHLPNDMATDLAQAVNDAPGLEAPPCTDDSRAVIFRRSPSVSVTGKDAVEAVTIFPGCGAGVVQDVHGVTYGYTPETRSLIEEIRSQTGPDDTPTS